MRVIVYVAVIIGGRMSLRGAPGEGKYLIMRSVSGFFATSSAYMSYRLISFSDASTIIFAAPVFVSIFGKFLLGEDCGYGHILNLVLAIFGVMLISKPSFLFDKDTGYAEPEYQIEGVSIAIFSSLCFALTFVLMRKLQKTESEVIIFWFAFSSILLGLASCFALELTTEYEPSLPSTVREIGLLFLNGIVGVISQPLLTIALKIEEAGVISLARTIDVVMAFAFQATLLKEPIGISSAVGALVICFSVFTTIMRKWKKQNPASFAKYCMFCVKVDDEGEERRLRQGPLASYTGLDEEDYP